MMFSTSKLRMSYCVRMPGEALHIELEGAVDADTGRRLHDAVRYLHRNHPRSSVLLDFCDEVDIEPKGVEPLRKLVQYCYRTGRLVLLVRPCLKSEALVRDAGLPVSLRLPRHEWPDYPDLLPANYAGERRSAGGRK